MPVRRLSRMPLLLLCVLASCIDRSGVPASSAERRAPAAAVRQVEDLAPGIEAALTTAADTERSAGEWAELRRLYAAGRDAPIWIEQGQLGANGRDALALLRASSEEGLEPSDYGIEQLEPLAAGALDRPQDAIRLDIGISAGTLRYFRDLHLGRVDGRDLGFRLRAPSDPHDFVEVVRVARAARRLGAAAAELRPPLGQYEILRTALGTYRALAASGPAESLPGVARSVHRGEPYPALQALRQRLIVLGDLPPSSASPAIRESDPYDGAIVEGVLRFQRRHGLQADGVLGQRTLDALNVPLAWRVRQIELALERLRWLPDFDDAPLIAINIPMFRLWAWDGSPVHHMPSLDMAVIVGQAVKWETPVFDERLRSIIFQPYWNVPRSILRSEILPRLARDPAYLSRENLEIVRGATDDAVPVDPTDENMALLRQGVFRLRQRPGVRNALGTVKFVFPNDEDVYMHATPAPELFGRTRRDFSHGCVRLERPEALAEWALRTRPEWTADRVRQAMNDPQRIEVRLPRPIRVVLFYTTAAVLSADGTIHFAEDIYGRDGPLDQALRRRSQRGF